jgi:hypothetical protein
MCCAVLCCAALLCFLNVFFISSLPPHNRSHNNKYTHSHTHTHRSTRDAKMPPSSSSLYECTNELLMLTDTLHTELCADPSIQLLRRSFVALAKRAKDCAQGVKKGLFGGGEKGFLAG